MQAHWPAPVYPALAICAAMMATRDGRSGPWTALRTAAPIFGLAACAAALVVVVAPPIGGFDPALPLRGWPAFARSLDAARVRAGAAWVGTASYGLDAELADEPGLRAPVVQLAERERYRDLALGPAPDFARPGLMIDLPRRIDIAALRACFARVTPLGALVRGGSANRPGKTYQALLVSGPRRDVLRDGCAAGGHGAGVQLHP